MSSRIGAQIVLIKLIEMHDQGRRKLYSRDWRQASNCMNDCSRSEDNIHMKIMISFKRVSRLSTFLEIHREYDKIKK